MSRLIVINVSICSYVDVKTYVRTTTEQVPRLSRNSIVQTTSSDGIELATIKYILYSFF